MALNPVAYTESVVRSFLRYQLTAYPFADLRLRDEGAPPGISAVLVYPMNALAEEQLMRSRGLLAGTGIPFGTYVGNTPEHETEVAGVPLRPGSSRVDYEARLERHGFGTLDRIINVPCYPTRPGSRRACGH